MILEIGVDDKKKMEKREWEMEVGGKGRWAMEEVDEEGEKNTGRRRNRERKKKERKARTRRADSAAGQNAISDMPAGPVSLINEPTMVKRRILKSIANEAELVLSSRMLYFDTYYVVDAKITRVSRISFHV
jgi:hypothetical protein